MVGPVDVSVAVRSPATRVPGRRVGGNGVAPLCGMSVWTPCHPVTVVTPIRERGRTRASRWSAPLDERPRRPGPGVLGSARDVGDGVAAIPEPEEPAGG